MKPILRSVIFSPFIAAVGLLVVGVSAQASASQRLPPLRFGCYLAGSIYQGYQLVLRNQSARPSPPGTVVRWRIPVPQNPQGSFNLPKTPQTPFLQTPTSPPNPFQGAYAIPQSLAPGGTNVGAGKKFALNPI
jgi:hypothetical protein